MRRKAWAMMMFIGSGRQRNSSRKSYGVCDNDFCIHGNSWSNCNGDCRDNQHDRSYCLDYIVDHIVVRADSGINTVEELQGKTVSIGEEESGTEQNAKQILAAYGLDEKLVKEVNLNYTDAAKQLQSGEIDALFCTSGVKTEMIEELANSCGIALLPVDGSAAARLLAAYPAYSQGVIPAGSYNGQDQDVPTIGVKAVLLASDELSENTVKALTKTLYDGVDTLQAELGLPLELGPADKIGVPVHAGAAAYYQENGMAAGEDAA